MVQMESEQVGAHVRVAPHTATTTYYYYYSSWFLYFCCSFFHAIISKALRRRLPQPLLLLCTWYYSHTTATTINNYSTTDCRRETYIAIYLLPLPGWSLSFFLGFDGTTTTTVWRNIISKRDGCMRCGAVSDKITPDQQRTSNFVLLFACRNVLLADAVVFLHNNRLICFVRVKKVFKYHQVVGSFECRCDVVSRRTVARPQGRGGARGVFSW